MCSGPRRSRGPTYQDRAPERAGQAGSQRGAGGARRRAGSRSAGLGPVVHRDQAQALGRRRIGRTVPGRGPQALEQGGRIRPPTTDLDQAADERADHLMAEGIGLDLEAEQATGPDVGQLPSLRRGTIWPASPAGQWALRGSSRACAGKRSGNRGCPAGRPTPPPWPADPADRAHARPWGPTGGRGPGRSTPGSGRCGPAPSAGRRTWRRPRRPRSTTMDGASWRLSARARPTPSKGTGGRSTWTTWPRACTPASVRPAQVRWGGSLSAGRPTEGVAQGPGHRRDLGLEGEAAEGGTVVGDQEPPALQLLRQRCGVRRDELAQIDAGTRRTQSAPSARCRPGAGRA